MGDLKKYRREKSELNLLLKYFKPKGKIVIDVGCGSGYLSFQLVRKGAFVFGLDIKEVIKRIKIGKYKKRPVFDEGTAEKLPFRKSFADVIIYYSSFHHVPKRKMKKALSECKRVLKPGGLAIFVEPSPEKGCYYELLRIFKDEKEIQKYVYSVIKKPGKFGLISVKENYFYMNRMFKDYLNAVNRYIEQKDEREKVLNEAEAKMRKAIFKDREEYKNLFKSTSRINIFRKEG